MHPLLRSIHSPDDFRDWPVNKLEQLADEIRDVLTNLVATRTAHYASNLGVVELCLALHSVYADEQARREAWPQEVEDGVLKLELGDHIRAFLAEYHAGFVLHVEGDQDANPDVL